jgi:hypothetical protein
MRLLFKKAIKILVLVGVVHKISQFMLFINHHQESGLVFRNWKSRGTTERKQQNIYYAYICRAVYVLFRQAFGFKGFVSNKVAGAVRTKGDVPDAEL